MCIDKVSLKTICLSKAFLHYYYADNDAKSMVKHSIFPQKFAVISYTIPYLFLFLQGDGKIVHKNSDKQIDHYQPIQHKVADQEHQNAVVE